MKNFQRIIKSQIGKGFRSSLVLALESLKSGVQGSGGTWVEGWGVSVSISAPGLFRVSKVKASLEVKINIGFFAKQKQAKQNIQNKIQPFLPQSYTANSQEKMGLG